jgi:hypothetical protein
VVNPRQRSLRCRCQVFRYVFRCQHSAP